MRSAGFTLIEISIVLVIIGLIIGGVVAGQEMIANARMRAQMSQIEQYQIVVKTFKIKYNCLPGDCRNGLNFGFTRSSPGTAGQGDGNERIAMGSGSGVGGGLCHSTLMGEPALFWRDLSDARLIEDTFSTATGASPPTDPVNGSAVSLYLPRAKIGNGGYVYVWHGGHGFMTCNGTTWLGMDGYNYFGVSQVNGGLAAFDYLLMSMPTFTVLQAYMIDSKLDDGLPQSGRVLALEGGYIGWSSGGPTIASASGITFVNSPGAYDSVTFKAVTSSTSPAVSTPAASYTCYDNGNVANATEQYSIGTNGGSNVNCNLSFRMY